MFYNDHELNELHKLSVSLQLLTNGSNGKNRWRFYSCNLYKITLSAAKFV